MSKNVIHTGDEKSSVGKERLDKNYHAKELLKNGYIESYVDYFYLVSRKTPDIKKMKYEKDQIRDESDEMPLELSYQYEPAHLKTIRELLYNAEEHLREGGTSHINSAIEEYRKLGYSTQYKDNLGAIYFIQKCINLAKRYEMITQIIKALIEMGTRFDNSDDLLLSMSFKEEAKNLFRHLKEKNHPLEAYIYNSLILLYKDLSSKAENQNDQAGAISYLNSQLENLKNLIEIIPNLKDDKYKEAEYMEQINDVYLKIANMHFKMKLYDDTIENLKNLDKLFKQENLSDSNNMYAIKGLYLYAKAYEAKEDYDKSIHYLSLITKNRNQANMQGSDENIYSKAYLDLGRLNFKLNNLDLAYENLRSFLRREKGTDNKELFDIGRVNSGMIRATQGMKDYIDMIKNVSVKEFLGLKLKYFHDN